MTPTELLLTAVTIERVGELFWARRNTAALLAAGAREYAPGHYPMIVALHAAWLATVWLWGWDRELRANWLCVFLALQILRVWVLATLGSRWTTRILVIADEKLVALGPYRYVSHPNYIVVIGEILALPMALGLVGVALAFSAANLVLLSIRMRFENEALLGARRERRT